MSLDLTPNAFKRRVSVAMDRATPGTKRMLGYAAMSDGIGDRYEIRLLKNGSVQATYTMTGRLPYSLSTGLAPTATLIASVTQTADIDLTSGTWTVEIASTVNIGWKITGTLGTSGTDFTLGGVAPPPAPAPAAVGPVGQNASLWTRTFTDEFDGSSLDATKWGTVQFYGEYEVLPNGSKVAWSGTTATNYDVNASGNSCLRIWPALSGGSHWVERSITTDPSVGPRTGFTQQYGYFESRIKLPRGAGLWPGFWLYGHPTGARPEIDIMEAWNGGPSTGWSSGDTPTRPNNYGASVHLRDASDNQIVPSQGPFKLDQFFGAQYLDDAFHVYGVRWTSTQVIFYFDGQVLTSRTFSLPYSCYIWLSLWYGSAAGVPSTNTGITTTGSSNAFEIDYVRVWAAV